MMSAGGDVNPSITPIADRVSDLFRLQAISMCFMVWDNRLVMMLGRDGRLLKPGSGPHMMQAVDKQQSDRGAMPTNRELLGKLRFWPTRDIKNQENRLDDYQLLDPTKHASVESKIKVSP